MKQISVIVPIYNVEAYVRDCFESLLQQDFDSYQVVAVNDGSPANEQVIIDEYVAKYPDIFKGIKKENGGYGSVLQLAIEQMDTPYFIVCDPDDTLQPNALTTLYQLIKAHNADIAVGCKSYIYHNSDKKDYHSVVNETYFKLDDLFIGSANNETIEPFYFMDPSPHAKLYKTQNALGCQFPTKIAYTDNLLYFYNLAKANKVVYTSESLANYLVDRPNNSMSDMKPRAIEANMKVIESIISNCENKKVMNDLLAYRLFESFKWVISLENKTTQSLSEKKAQAKEFAFMLNLFKRYPSLLTYYKKYNKSGFMERYRDRKILKGNIKAFTMYIDKTIH